MSLKPSEVQDIPSTTATIARKAFPKGNRVIRLRDALGTVFTDRDFTSLYPTRGKHALQPWRLALITVFQFLENLSDRDAAEAVRARLDWKYALGLELDDPGFDHSVLCEFRQRLTSSNPDKLLLDKLLEQCREHNLLKAGGKARTDSTHVLAAVRRLNRVEVIGETLRALLNDLAELEPEWLQGWVPAEWFKHYASRIEYPSGQRSESAEKRLERILRIARDGFVLFERATAGDAPDSVRQCAGLEWLRRCWLGNFYVEHEAQGSHLRWREAGNLPGMTTRLDSPYDPEARYGAKGGRDWVGYKVHVTETCDEALPHLLTVVETAPAYSSDMAYTPKVHQTLKGKELLPETHLVDGGYVDAQLIVDAKKTVNVRLLGPVKRMPVFGGRTERFDLSQFKIDWEARTATCPEGKVSIMCHEHTYRNEQRLHLTFSRVDCRACPARERCTSSVGQPRKITLRSPELHEVLHEARAAQRTQAWYEEYKLRQGVEATFSQGVRGFGLRACRYWGLVKSHLQHVCVAMAINWVRLDDWFAGRDRAGTRVSRFARLMPAAA